MPLPSGTRLGPYEITGTLGAGGMGEVYRAIDTTLGRKVAIKVLPDAFAQDADRIARFGREAKTLASLNHPNIAQIFGLEQTDGIKALVMELVEGPTLAERISEGPIPIDEALPIARQIAEALEAAHEQDIIHRDLKPANVKVRADGTVKVLDFGLAKAMEPAAGSSPSASMSPTITTPAMTQAGMILGTAAYMSPEQARGKTVDRRSDIWAFGCVLYEMLTGGRAFHGEDVADTLANVLKTEPNLSALPSETPPAIRTLLESCLTKDHRHRLPFISTALFLLEKCATLGPPAGPLPARSSKQKMWRHAGTYVGAAVVGAALATTTLLIATREVEPTRPRVSRLQFAWSDNTELSIGGLSRDLTITPDGSRVVYVGNLGTQLFVRALDAIVPMAVVTGAPRHPFVSADGQWIGFTDGPNLKKVAVTGGPSVELATLDGTPNGATWGPEDDTIIAASFNAITGLQRVRAAGGPLTVLTRPNRSQGELDHVWPERLPGGRAVLFTITAVTGLDAAQVAVLDLQTGTHKILVRGGSHAHYVSSGHLVYVAGGTLRAVAFDLTRLETRGTSVPIIPGVMTTQNGAMDAAIADDGTLAYVPGNSALSGSRTLVWADREGHETPIPAPPRAFNYPRLSPDGTRIAVAGNDQELDLWLWDVVRTTFTRLTLEPGVDLTPVWTPDSKRLVFASSRGGQQNLFVQSADGTGSATRLSESPYQQNPSAITADGTRVVFTEVTPTRQRDLRLLLLTPTPRVEPLLETPSDERGGIVSPDGRWLAYESSSSGQFEIYVRPFPNVDDGQWQVSNANGIQPLWSRSGRELFYRTPDGALLKVAVDPRGSAWRAGAATKVLEGYYAGANIFVTRQYDVSADGQRFLMIKEGDGTGAAAAAPSLIVVQNWVEELKRLVPVN